MIRVKKASLDQLGHISNIYRSIKSLLSYHVGGFSVVVHATCSNTNILHLVFF